MGHAYRVTIGVSLEGGPSRLRYRAVCECGDFAGSWRTRRYEVHADHAGHLAAVPPPPPRMKKQRQPVAPITDQVAAEVEAIFAGHEQGQT